MKNKKFSLIHNMKCSFLKQRVYGSCAAPGRVLVHNPAATSGQMVWFIILSITFCDIMHICAAFGESRIPPAYINRDVIWTVAFHHPYQSILCFMNMCRRLQFTLSRSLTSFQHATLVRMSKRYASTYKLYTHAAQPHNTNWRCHVCCLCWRIPCARAPPP